MVKRVIKKLISVVVISSLLISSTCVYVQARDIKLSIVLMLDKVEDMEYRKRESSYKAEHLSFLSKSEKADDEFVDVNNVESELAGDSFSSLNENNKVDGEFVGDSFASPDVNFITPTTDDTEFISSDTNYESEPEEDTEIKEVEKINDDIKEEVIDVINTSTNSVADIEVEIYSEEKEEDIKESEEDNEILNSEEMSIEREYIIDNSEVEVIEEEFNISTKSEIEEEESKPIVERNKLLGVGSDTELFTMPISDSEFTIKAVTKKSRRGGQTCLGVIVCGIMQTGFMTNPNSFLRAGCSNSDRHQVKFDVYKEDEEGNEVFVYTDTKKPTEIAYPDYSQYNSTFVEEKKYNVQSDLFSINSPFKLNTRYNITEKASGCEDYEIEDVEVGDDYESDIPPIRAIHTGDKVYDTADGSEGDMVNSVDSCTFLFYKVKYGDVLEKLAMHYGVNANDIGLDNHFSKLMCYEGDILFIRDPKTTEPYENDLSPAELAKFKKLVNLVGYEEAMCAFELEPINMSTGDFYLEHTDFIVPEVMEEFKISRSYNSIGRIIKSEFGYGFNSIVSDRLMVEDNGTVIHFREDGGGETYKTNGDGTYRASKGYNVLKAVKDESGGSYEEDEYDDSGEEEEDSVGRSNYWQLICEDGEIRTYNGYGTLISKTNKKGLTYTYNYDSGYKLKNIISPSGFKVEFSYNDKNLINKILLPDETYITYEYDEYKNLVKVIDAENRTTTYKYDDNGVDSKLHLMTSFYDSDNIRQVLNTYDSDGRVIEQVDANGNTATISYYENRTVMIDNEGNEQVFMLDGNLRTNKKLYGESSEVEYENSFNENSKVESKRDGNGVIISYTYDSKGNVIIERKSDGEFTINKTYTYDDRKNKLTETDYNGNITSYSYDSKSNLTKIIYANGKYEEMTYDSMSRITSKRDKNGNITRYSYSGSNPLPSEVIDARGNKTEYRYDGMRRKIREIDAKGNSYSISYDKTGRKIKETDKRGNETKYRYENRGTVEEIEDRENNITEFRYDNVGNITKGIDSENNIVEYEYDKNSNKILTKNANNETRFVYNVKGQVIEEIDAIGSSRKFTVDGVGNIIKEIDRNGNEINYRYNNVLNKVIERSDGNGKVWRYNYDNNGNLLKEIKPDSSEINYRYDEVNQLISVINEEGIETNFTYDANGNLIKKVIGARNLVGSSFMSPYLGSNTLRSFEYTYDECNNLIEEKTPNGYKNKCEYDSIGNIIKIIDENNYEIEYIYDENSNIIEIIDAKGNNEEYTYNRENKKTAYRDKNGHITRFNYDRAGRVVEKINALNEREQLEYDSNDNITKNILYNADGSVFSEIERKYNELNKLVEEIDAENYKTTYTYDNNENIVSITNKNGDTQTFSYDASNNVVEKTDEMGLITQYEYDDNYNIIKISDNANNDVDDTPIAVGAKLASPTQILYNSCNHNVCCTL